MKLAHRILAIWSLLLITLDAHSQKFEWVNFFQGQNIQAPVSLGVDAAGNQYASFYFKNEIKFKSITVSKNNYQSGLVLKQDTEGNVLWYEVMEGIREDLYTLDSKFNSKGNLIVLVTAAGPSILVGADTLKRNGSGTDFAFYLLEFNDTGKLINGNHLIDGTFYGFNVGRILASDKNDNLYLVNAYIGQVQVYDSSGTINLGSSTSGARNIIFKFSRSGKKLEWTSTLPYSGLLVYNIKVDIHENVYAATYWTASSSSTFTFNGQTMRNPQTATGAVFVWDKMGNDKSFFCIKASDKKSVIYDIAVYDSNSVFISGSYQGDSALFDTVWEKNNKFGGYLFYAKYDINGNLKWLNVEDTSYTTTIYPNKYYCGMTNYKDAFFYLSYFMPYHYGEPVIFDGQKYEAKPKGYGLNLKVDEKGNILWGFRTLYPFSAMGTDANDNLYFQGRWDGDTIKFNNIKAFPTGTDGFLGKTTDYAITRGNVYAGPYCAGDTINVPFTKNGDFDTSNFFIAELSDEFGIFDGRERELGRVKATKDSLVIGTLPLFKTASSGNYRIRIISTNPIVQSFYKLDSLRLLIYSRDKADPGPTDTLCLGDTIKLTTYGGTKWTWSPKYNMNDSNLRQPLVWPSKDTSYQIIIDDSSGCGEPDTAIKSIVLRQPLQLSIAFIDTVVCDSSLLSLPLDLKGGNSSQYILKTYNIDSMGAWKLLTSEFAEDLDTLHFLPKIGPGAKQKIAILLDDQCTLLKDTAYLFIQTKVRTKISSKFNDTQVCVGNIIQKKATALDASGKYQWLWQDMTNNRVLSQADTLNFEAKATTAILLTANNGCSADSNWFTVVVSPPLKVTLWSGGQPLNDTSLCFGQSLNLQSISTGGLKTGYQREWQLDGKLVSRMDTFLLSSSMLFPDSGGTKQIRLILKDNCTLLSDTFSRNIKVLEAPMADFKNGIACNRSNIEFRFTGKKTSSGNTFNWEFEGEGSSNAENPDKTLRIPGSRKVTLMVIAGNGCKSEISKQVEVKPQSKADFIAVEYCDKDSVEFINLSEAATDYIWNFGDSSQSEMTDLKHLYARVKDSQNFEVKLVAVVKDGCSDSITKSVKIVESPRVDFDFEGICKGETTNFTFTGSIPQLPNGSDFTWNFNNEGQSSMLNPSYTFSDAGKKWITLLVECSNGCSDSMTKVLDIKVRSKADFLASDVCESDSAFMENRSKDATNYFWKFGDGNTSNRISPKHLFRLSGQSATYNITLVARVDNGCPDSITKPVNIFTNPISDFNLTQSGSTLELKATQTNYTRYIWKFGDTDSVITSSSSYTHTMTKPDHKKVCLKIVNDLGCVSQTCKLSTLNISKLNSDPGFWLYPNPNQGDFTIEYAKGNGEFLIEIVNQWGQIVYSNQTNRVNRHPMSLKLSSGVYTVRLKSGNYSFKQRMIVSH